MTDDAQASALREELARLRRDNRDLRARLERERSRGRGVAADALLYRSAIASLAEGVVVIDAEGIIQTCNPATEAILGLSEDQMAGRSSVDERWRAIRPDGSEYPGAEHPSVVTLRTGEPVRNEVMGIYQPDGRLTWISINTEPLFRDGRDRPDAVVASFVDITAHSEALAALRRSEERLLLALSAARMGIWEWDLVDQRVYWSDTVEGIFGLEPGTFDGTYESYVKLLHPDDRDHVLEDIEHALSDPEAGENYDVEHRVVGTDGDVRWVRGSGRVIRDPDGNPIGMRGVVADLSERKELESQLAHGRKMESIGRLAGGVAHDFNNLLTAMFSAIDRVRELTADRRDVRSPLQVISDAASRAGHLTEQLLTFARTEPVSVRSCNVDQIIVDLARLLRSMIGEDVDLRTRIASAPWSVRADPHQIEQVVVNLVVNAREAMPDGGTLSIETSPFTAGEAFVRRHPGLAPGEYVSIAVQDDGEGMAPEVAERVFEPFFSTKDSGSGLGLATCYGIVQQCNGHISCSSRPGVGTTFSVLFPRARGAARTMATVARPRTRAGGETLLVVEDDALVRGAVVSYLGQRGYRVHAAADAEEALAVSARLDHIDLVISDVVMPGLSGPELADSMRRERPGVRFLFVSGYPDRAFRGEFELDADTSFMPKPYTPAQMNARLRQILGES